MLFPNIHHLSYQANPPLNLGAILSEPSLPQNSSAWAMSLLNTTLTSLSVSAMLLSGLLLASAAYQIFAAPLLPPPLPSRALRFFLLTILLLFFATGTYALLSSPT